MKKSKKTQNGAAAARPLRPAVARLHSIPRHPPLPLLHQPPRRPRPHLQALARDQDVRDGELDRDDVRAVREGAPEQCQTRRLLRAEMGSVELKQRKIERGKKGISIRERTTAINLAVSMASPVVDCATPIRGVDMEEDEEELFEINLEAVNGIPPQCRPTTTTAVNPA
ncbi:uncharacterized protein LOC131165961 [Malania oleifera]|uniref:uncharacterized protein LOC131165961 n=1 Tax=Malania oleifera TaxID=397392 RepID=UPI0025ADD5CF|nr:uncharacterized protein LOC131165961 [Malania oleifera]